MIMPLVLVALAAPPATLPLPAEKVPDNPPFPPTVITAGGQRLLFGQTDTAVRYDPAEKRLVVNRPGWWVVNYPLDKIAGFEGKSADTVAQALFGKPARDVKNWYVRTPGHPAPEPTPPSGPARFEPHPKPTFVVNQKHGGADDANPGTEDRPFRTIAAAVRKTGPGDVIRVYPGIYREHVEPKTAGTADRRIVLEGVPDEKGNLPVVTANDPAPDAWTQLGKGPVYRADTWHRFPGPVTAFGSNLIERTVVAELANGQFCRNRGAKELAFPRLHGGIYPKPEDVQLGAKWRELTADKNGFLDLGNPRGVYYLSTWAWFPPEASDLSGWNGDDAAAMPSTVYVTGGFRNARMSGIDSDNQPNPYRVWVNGKLMPAAPRAGEPRSSTDYNPQLDTWQHLPLREGWNHLVLLVDSTVTRNENYPPKLSFSQNHGGRGVVTRSTAPADRSQPPAGKPDGFLKNWLALGPLPDGEFTKTDNGVYVHLNGFWPSHAGVDAPARTAALTCAQPFWTIRGLEFRHGSQFHQSALVTVSSEGDVVEFCKFYQPDVRGLTAGLQFLDQTKAPVVFRGNWIRSPGGLGIGAAGTSERLTADNQDANAPGLGRILVEGNMVVDNNRSGYERAWESGGMKFICLSGSVVRHNATVGGDGPGLWFDWEHFNNRIEGNLAVNPVGYAVGVEASPGSNLLANNVAVGTRADDAFFRYALLAWSSGRVSAVHNTVDGRLGDGLGACLAEGPNDRGTRWGTSGTTHAGLRS